MTAVEQEINQAVSAAIHATALTRAQGETVFDLYTRAALGALRPFIGAFEQLGADLRSLDADNRRLAQQLGEATLQLQRPHAPCPNMSFYGRQCGLPAHDWRQPCQFQPDPDELDYDLTDSSTMRDLLEALTAGGTVAVSAAMRWVEYRLHCDATYTEETFGADHPIAQSRWNAVGVAQREREIVMRYLNDRAEEVPNGG